MSQALRFSATHIDDLAKKILSSGVDSTVLLGADLAKLAARIPSSEQVTPEALVHLALLNDALCVAERAIHQDGVISEAEIAYVEPLAREAHKYLSRVRSVYRETIDLDKHGVALFLDQHAKDTQRFGGKCRGTAWLGLHVCQRAAEASGDSIYVDQYRDLVSRTLDELYGEIGSGTPERRREIVAELGELLPPPEPTRDLREAAYCATDSAEVFHAVAHSAEVFTSDPFDVDTIHKDARFAFGRLLDRASEAKFGKILLIKGEAGSGKTHLMRAFRNQTHGEHLGFAGYMQMSTRVSNYARYILSNLIESWDRPYWGEAIPESALTCLSDAVAGHLPPELLRELQDPGLGDDALHALVNRGADRLLSLAPLENADVDVLRMMLYLQRREPARRARVLKFLRCEPLNDYERSLVGGAYPPSGEEGPAQMLTHLGRLVAMTGNGALVLLIDQLEDIFNLEGASERFRRAMDALRHVTDHVPSSVVVVACLEDFYTKLRGELAKPILERIEQDPDPVRLTAGRTIDEIEELVGRRLQYLFERKDVLVREEEPLYPFTYQELAARVQHRTRDVLDWCRMHHEASIAAGRITRPADPSVEPPAQPDPSPILDLTQEWNDFRANASAPPADDLAIVQLLSWGLRHLAREHGGRLTSDVASEENYVDVTLQDAKLTVAICDKAPQGGHLGNQITALSARARARGSLPVVVRSSEYPPPGRTRIAQQLKALLQAGGRRVVATDSEWRFMGALRAFCEEHAGNPLLGAWLEQERPLSGVASIRSILDLDDLHLRPTATASMAPGAPGAATATSASAEPSAPGASSTGDAKGSPAASGSPERTAPTAAKPLTTQPTAPLAAAPLTSPTAPLTSPTAPLTSPTTEFSVGQTRGLSPRPVATTPNAFITHAAFLGSSGSGKTTLALAILEHLLTRGTPVVMIDRKGDLCTYARPEFWEAPAPDPEVAERKRALRERAEVCIFTPGEPRGRDLMLPVVPSGLGDLPAHERGMVARHAASALGAMMGYRKSRTDDTRLGILGKAIELVGTATTDKVGIGELVKVLDEEDPELLSLVGRLDTKHFRALVENLETLRLRYEHLLREDGERLSPELLFGTGEHRRPRTRLSIISTKFLGDNAAIDFWIARLLGDLSRWASRSPASSLQAALFLDEADIYLPAQTKPATKEPMLDLLKRARSAGLGVFLATQSPGDLDYRCRDNIRTWFVGRVAEKTAVEKMKPLLSESRVNVSSKLANAKVGEFFKLQDGDAVELKATPSLMRTEQLPEDEIVRLAQRSSAAAPSTSG